MRGRGAILAACGAVMATLASCGAAAPLAGTHSSGAPVTATRGQATHGTPAGSGTTLGAEAVDVSPAAPPSVPADVPTGQFRHLTIDGEAFPRPAWVAVPVATVWTEPGFVRPVDSPVVQDDPQVAGWVASMTLSQKLDLDQRVQTQALLDDPLSVLDLQGNWAHVLVDDQTGSVYKQGIEGWVPRAQITFAPLRPTAVTATVNVPFTKAGGMELSYGTRLPVIGSTTGYEEVATPVGLLQVASRDVSTAPLAPSGSAVLRQAEQFVGLPYLWAGTSAYGFDCSGLTYAVYRQFGVTLARDAGDQAQEGTPVLKQDLRPGDLVFFASGGVVHHVGFYAGSGMMFDAPQTGGRVEMVPLWSSYLASQYAGARRYINT
jgi:cell wall-associated NlpC family hydrolase